MGVKARRHYVDLSEQAAADTTGEFSCEGFTSGRLYVLGSAPITFDVFAFVPGSPTAFELAQITQSNQNEPIALPTPLPGRMRLNVVGPETILLFPGSGPYLELIREIG